MKEFILKTWSDYFSKDALQVQDALSLKIWKKKETELNISWLKLNDFQLITLSESYFEKIKNKFNREIFIDDFEEFITGIDFKFNPADLIYYLDQYSFKSRISNNPNIKVRLLTMNDLNIFNQMTENCSEEDLDAGFVDLEHTIVVGLFANSKLVVCASAYPFLNSESIYDIGYITDPGHRGQGLATICTSHLVENILINGKVPQIRMQPDLISSIKVAEKLGFNRFGEWRYDLL
jgi:predicted GNAT family acetyltransferase